MQHSFVQGENNVDSQYLNLLRDVYHNGHEKETRSGKVWSLFGHHINIPLKYGFPALTTKKLFFKGAKVELLWFLSGDTNIKYLIDNGVHIWDDDAYRGYLELYNGCPLHNADPLSKEEYLKKVESLGYDETMDYLYGDLGPVYGAQWRGFGYISVRINKYIDQIKGLIDKLKNSPDDRRMLVDSWNVEALPYMALPPCHYSFQVYTYEASMEEIEEYKELHPEYKDKDIKRKISLLWNQRSCDLFLGLPFNIASYALLTFMLAKECDMIPDMLIGNFGDCHIYQNHEEAVKEQLSRNPNKYNLPQIWLNPDVKSIFEYKPEDIKLIDYESYSTIKAPLSVGLSITPP